MEGTVPPKSVQIASWILVLNAIIVKLLIPMGTLAFSALHSRGLAQGHAADILSAGGWIVFLAVAAPTLLVAVLLFVKLRQGRNWARIIVVIVTVVSLLLTIRNFQTLLVVYGKHLDLAVLGTFFIYACVSPVTMLLAVVLLFSATANTFFRGETYE